MRPWPMQDRVRDLFTILSEHRSLQNERASKEDIEAVDPHGVEFVLGPPYFRRHGPLDLFYFCLEFGEESVITNTVNDDVAILQNGPTTMLVDEHSLLWELQTLHGFEYLADLSEENPRAV